MSQLLFNFIRCLQVRHQFNTIPGLMEGTARPDYRRCVEISTQASISEMVPPGCLVMGTPIVVGESPRVVACGLQGRRTP